MKTTPFLSKLIVAVDPEGHAAQAVIRGHGLAQEMGIGIKLVMGVPVPPLLWPGTSQETLQDLHASTLQRAGEQAIQSLEEPLKAAQLKVDLARELEVLPGHPAKVVLQKAHEYGANLILMGAHQRRSGLDFGSTTRRVFSHSKIPIWIQAGPCQAIQKILVPMDFSEHAEQAARHAQALAKFFGASVQVLHCFVPPDFALPDHETSMGTPTYVIDHERQAWEERLQSWMQDFPWDGVSASARFVEGGPQAAILEAAKAHDLVIMGTHGRTGFARFLLGGVAYGVLKHATTPILAIPSLDVSWLIDDEPAGLTTA